MTKTKCKLSKNCLLDEIYPELNANTFLPYEAQSEQHLTNNKIIIHLIVHTVVKMTYSNKDSKSNQ